MQNKTCAASCAPSVFVLPEKGHLELVQMRDHLRLLAQLTETGATRHDAQVRPDALAWWFSRFARDLDGVINSTYWSPNVAA